MSLDFNGLVLESFVAEVTQPEARVALINVYVATSLNVERVSAAAGSEVWQSRTISSKW